MLADAPTESVAVSIKLYMPPVVGVPVRIPVLVRDSPGGKAAAGAVNVSGPVPPVAPIVWL